MLPNLSTLRLKPVPRDDLILVCNVDDIAAKRKLDEADAVDDSRFDTPIDAPDELLLYNLPDDILIQILSVPQDCESLLNMCSDIPEFSTICADDNHRFWQAVLLRKGWMVDWAKSGSEPGGISAKQFYLMVCDIATKQTPWKIPDAWMQGNTQLVLKSLPSQITHIGRDAFRGCTSLALQELPPNLNEIGLYAFAQCTSLVLQALPPKLKIIREGVFSDCTSLALQELPPNLNVIERHAFAQCTSLALQELPPNLYSIGSYAFAQCTSLALQALPPKLEFLGKSAFSECAKLALQALPPNLKIIRPNAFSECTSLALQELPSVATLIGPFAFDGCTKLALRELPSNLQWIFEGAFRNCKSLALGDFTDLPAELSIYEFAFSGCDHLIRTPFGMTVLKKEGEAFSSYE